MFLPHHPTKCDYHDCDDLFTHFPNDLNCYICKRTKITKDDLESTSVTKCPRLGHQAQHNHGRMDQINHQKVIGNIANGDISKSYAGGTSRHHDAHRIYRKQFVSFFCGCESVIFQHEQTCQRIIRGIGKFRHVLSRSTSSRLDYKAGGDSKKNTELEATPSVKTSVNQIIPYSPQRRLGHHQTPGDWSDWGHHQAPGDWKIRYTFGEGTFIPRRTLVENNASGNSMILQKASASGATGKLHDGTAQHLCTIWERPRWLFVIFHSKKNDLVPVHKRLLMGFILAEQDHEDFKRMPVNKSFQDTRFDTVRATTLANTDRTPKTHTMCKYRRTGKHFVGQESGCWVIQQQNHILHCVLESQIQIHPTIGQPESATFWVNVSQSTVTDVNNKAFLLVFKIWCRKRLSG